MEGDTLQDLEELFGSPYRWDKECDKVVAVLGDENTYPCKLEAGHAGRCEPDYDAGS
jgi:hypothetical protein